MSWADIVSINDYLRFDKNKALNIHLCLMNHNLEHRDWIDLINSSGGVWP